MFHYNEPALVSTKDESSIDQTLSANPNPAVMILNYLRLSFISGSSHEFGSILLFPRFCFPFNDHSVGLFTFSFVWNVLYLTFESLLPSEPSLSPFAPPLSCSHVPVSSEIGWRPATWWLIHNSLVVNGLCTLL